MAVVTVWWMVVEMRKWRKLASFIWHNWLSVVQISRKWYCKNVNALVASIFPNLFCPNFKGNFNSLKVLLSLFFKKKIKNSLCQKIEHLGDLSSFEISWSGTSISFACGRNKKIGYVFSHSYQCGDPLFKTRSYLVFVVILSIDFLCCISKFSFIAISHLWTP